VIKPVRGSKSNLKAILSEDFSGLCRCFVMGFSKLAKPQNPIGCLDTGLMTGWLQSSRQKILNFIFMVSFCEQVIIVFA
jgi:hypothetical protein